MTKQMPGALNVVIVGLLGCVGCASIMGVDEPELADAPKSTPATPSNEKSAEAGQSVEQRVSTFPCGAVSCVAGQDACCSVGTNLSCNPITVGCGASIADGGRNDAEAGPPPGPVMTCTTYNNCQFGFSCCYVATTGSVCRQSCSTNEVQLCTLGVDSCGVTRDCKSMTNPPAASVGACVPAGGG